ncbi:RNA recognition motif domain-containing protein [Sarocladium implicatum]|nr:RNA recognition motif domain-containing protein [Sarocladium implicatum]
MGSQQTPDAVASAAFPRAEPRAPSHTTAHHALNSNFDFLSEDNMAASGYLPPSASMPSDHLQQTSRPFGMASHKLDQGLAPRPIGTPSSVTQILMRRLPPDTSEQSLQLMFVWSTELLDLKLLPVDQSYEDGSRSALLTFSTHGGAVDAREKLNGRAVQSNGADGMILEIIPKAVDRQGTTNGSPPGELHSAASSTASSASGSRQPSRVNGRLHSMDGIGASMGNAYGARDLSSNDTSPPLPSSMNRQPPIGSQRAERSSISSKALINGDSTADDETNDLIWNSVSFAENGIFTEPRANSQRRATAPQIPFTAAMASLSLNTNQNNAGSSPQPASLPQHYSSASAHNIVSPLSSAASPLPFPGANNHHFGRPMPAVNPADQNPPCNTLYVGNLPLDTSEEELKATFSKQRGYKRLCFRTKANGPMCFVEFEDISFATKALHDLYGHMLHNSTKGGIRLSFSKNPLGVRSGHGNHQSSSGQMGHINHMMSPNNNHFPTANGPPPGLAAPPGLSGGRAPYQANGHNHSSLHSFPNGRNNGWNRGHINDNHLGSNNGFPSSSGFVPPHMMGR